MSISRVLMCVASLTLGVSPLAWATVEIRVLSNRADLISGGDALIEVTGTNGGVPTLTINGEPATTETVNGRTLLTGLTLGTNLVEATLPDGSGASIEITNHPNGGPVFSGTLRQPWTCQNAGAFDDKCNQEPTYRFQYRPAGGGGWTDFDPTSPPARDDVATFTTEEGVFPASIRIETGMQLRDQYVIAGLVGLNGEPNGGWNGKVLIPHGASCGIEHHSGSAAAVTGGNADIALERGYAVLSTALNNSGHNCNLVTQAESMIMAKERAAETLGREIRYTIGTGCSGGALAQHQVANAYPEVYQGLLPQCSFPDAWSTGNQLVDYHLIRRYMGEAAGSAAGVTSGPRWGTGIFWGPRELQAVEGHPNHVNAIVLDMLYLTGLGNPTNPCPGTDETVPGDPSTRYHPETNPEGVRCTLADVMSNVFGPRSTRLVGRADDFGVHFAGRPLGNVGVQYGLGALERGEITPAQFVDLNARIGGIDLDINYTEEVAPGVFARTAADQPAITNAYRSGAINVGNNLDQLAILDLRGPDHGAFHDAYRSWAVRARIEREQGHFHNHVIWFGHVPLLGDVSWAVEGFEVMDEWLAGVEADGSGALLADRIVANRPVDLEDRCSQIPGVEEVIVPNVGRVCELEDVQSRYGTPRTVAGDSIATDTNECALKLLRRQDYYPVVFLDEEWAKLEATFPDGVCDFNALPPSRPLEGTTPNLTYQDGVDVDDDGVVETVIGGRPMGPPPISIPF